MQKAPHRISIDLQSQKLTRRKRDFFPAEENALQRNRFWRHLKLTGSLTLPGVREHFNARKQHGNT